MAASEQNLIWVDMEMTGLDPLTDKVLEIACIATDSQLNVLAESEVVVVHQSEAVLARMDEWCTNTHTNSGLVARVRATEVNENEAEQQILAFVKKWVPEGATPMCGNSIHQDRHFMKHHLPNLEKHFHYRNIDVSTIKELARRWRPDILAGVKKSGAHLAIDDIRESLAELQHYADHFFKLDGK
ncbi:oligoribonuclease [Alginatibacterium sediminis]|uniref:Oligoribonuclease n=1 Tax=Alginatibacterium sediminis TaxID=2164068 RepID=A0A420E796_9ALTE|nr:oligoribonuclease [Alginatibacterium sediminis]RKF14520.1 oligoribonuclease [Alginatibacterium sediminis]